MAELITIPKPHDDPAPPDVATSRGEARTLTQALVRDFSQPKTGIQDVDALFSLSKWDTTSLTFGFPDEAADYPARYNGRTAPNREPDNAFAQAPAALQAAIQAAARQFQDVTNLTLTQATDTTPDIAVAVSSLPNTEYAYYPGASAHHGDIWFGDERAPGVPNPRLTPVRGDEGWTAALHEFGHALGLKHPHETGNRTIVIDLPLVPDITINIPGPFTAARLERDSLEFSVMSYRSYVGASVDAGWTNETFGFPQTLMMDDIRALQEMYGANFETRSGDTTYRFSASTGEVTIGTVAQGAPGANRLFLTIWDGGGTDTYDFSDYTTGLTVDLTPGGWSRTSQQQLANLGDGEVARGNVFNALQFRDDPRSLIENTIGGSGNDRLAGNSANNEMIGGPGADSILGRDGQDTLIGDANELGVTSFIGFADQLFGGAHADSLFGDARIMRGGAIGGDDFLDGGAGDDQLVGDGALMLEFVFGRNDTLAGGEGDDTLFGDALAMSGSANGGNDMLFGGNGRDTLAGEAINMTGSARGGIDTLNGDGDNDFLFGDASNLMSGQAIGGGDTLLGGAGFDALFGDALVLSETSIGGNDVLGGGDDADSLFGDGLQLRDQAIGGNDRLDGGAGDDTMFGDGMLFDLASGGADTFIFAGAFGNDTVFDFRQGEDQLQFATPGVLGIGDLAIDLSGADTVITASAGNSVTLLGFVGTLDAADFII